MKVAILAGGAGTRLAEETDVRPKPMVEIGGRPILWHIMRHYAHYGFDDFVIALGYKGEYIKKFFVDYCELDGDLTIDFGSREVNAHRDLDPRWRVHLVETGLDTNTGGRVRRLRRWLGSETFMLTWGDGVSDIDLRRLLEFHRAHGKLATLTAVRPIARFGHLDLEGHHVNEFSEKPQTREGWINGAFFVCEPQVLDYVESDDTQWERGPLQALAREGQLMAYRHESFWQCMDTLREKRMLQEMWDSGDPPWRIWT